MKKYWLMKSEPEVYSIEHLAKDKKTWWEGVRNYQSRNFMLKEMSLDDEVLFYHSSTVPPGIAGVARISHIAKADSTQFNKKSDYFEPRATLEKPVWFCVQVEFVKKFNQLLTLEQLKKEKSLQDLLVVRKGQRLSVQPVSEKNFLKILELCRSINNE